MLLEVKCSIADYMDFLDKAEAAGVKPGFDMHGADENSSFSLVANAQNADTIDTNGAEEVEPGFYQATGTETSSNTEEVTSADV